MATSSFSRSSFDLRSATYFPSYRQLPFDNDINDLFYKPSKDGIYRPSHHWAFLAEIVEARIMRLPPSMNVITITGDLGFQRPCYLVRDREGTEINVAFHTEPVDMAIHGFDEKNYAVGNTMAVLYANRHCFMDGTEGLRIEELPIMKVIPCALETLLNVDPEVATTATLCKRCGTDNGKLLVCANCKIKYCSQWKCRHADWKAHKAECAAIGLVREWRHRDWSQFDGFWEETTMIDGLKLSAKGREKT
ncbi:unnamed protein product [Peniophora sp. CBMAI 1063]|nr:unnamed protein product [Peniophora sp. CBMAI 1063]